MKGFQKVLTLSIMAAFLAVIALPVGSSFAQEKDAMSKSSTKATELQKKSQTEMAQIDAKIKIYTAKLKDKNLTAKQRKDYTKKLKDLKDYKKIIVANLKSSQKCTDDACLDKKLAFLDRVGENVAKTTATETAAGTEVAPSQQAAAVAAAESTESTTPKGDALQTTVADATTASSLQSGGRIGAISPDGSAPPADPNATSTSPTDAASGSGDSTSTPSTVVISGQ